MENDLTVLRLGGYVFAGQYEDTSGTTVAFEECIDADNKKSLKYRCHSTKTLKASRTFLKPKEIKKSDELNETNKEAGNTQEADDNMEVSISKEDPG